jgi:hypothetical protein
MVLKPDQTISFFFKKLNQKNCTTITIPYRVYFSKEDLFRWVCFGWQGAEHELCS